MGSLKSEFDRMFKRHVLEVENPEEDHRQVHRDQRA